MRISVRLYGFYISNMALLLISSHWWTIFILMPLLCILPVLLKQQPIFIRLTLFSFTFFTSHIPIHGMPTTHFSTHILLFHFFTQNQYHIFLSIHHINSLRIFPFILQTANLCEVQFLFHLHIKMLCTSIKCINSISKLQKNQITNILKEFCSHSNHSVFPTSHTSQIIPYLAWNC